MKGICDDDSCWRNVPVNESVTDVNRPEIFILFAHATNFIRLNSMRKVVYLIGLTFKLF